MHMHRLLPSLRHHARLVRRKRSGRYATTSGRIASIGGRSVECEVDTGDTEPDVEPGLAN